MKFWKYGSPHALIPDWMDYMSCMIGWGKDLPEPTREGLDKELCRTVIWHGEGLSAESLFTVQPNLRAQKHYQSLQAWQKRLLMNYGLIKCKP